MYFLNIRLDKNDQLRKENEDVTGERNIKLPDLILSTLWF